MSAVSSSPRSGSWRERHDAVAALRAALNGLGAPLAEHRTVFAACVEKLLEVDLYACPTAHESTVLLAAIVACTDWQRSAVWAQPARLLALFRAVPKFEGSLFPLAADAVDIRRELERLGLNPHTWFLRAIAVLWTVDLAVGRRCLAEADALNAWPLHAHDGQRFGLWSSACFATFDGIHEDTAAHLAVLAATFEGRMA